MPKVKTSESDLKCEGVSQVPDFQGYLSIVIPTDLLPEDAVSFACMVQDTNECLMYPFLDGHVQFRRCVIRAYGPSAAQRKKVIE